MRSWLPTTRRVDETHFYGGRQRENRAVESEGGMTRLNLILLLALVISSVYLVRVSYDSRRLFAQLDRAQSEARQLEIEHERLIAEKQSQATPLRVVARDRLAMRNATPAVTQYVAYGASAAPAASAQGAQK
jgi:cell division protein FtsL